MPAYSKRQIYHITNRLYNLLREYPERIIFRKHGGKTVGRYDYKTGEITIDYRYAIIPTLVHEALHHWHPEWSETMVELTEKKIMNALTPKQIKNVIKVMGECL